MTRKEAVEILEDEMYMIWETASEKAFAMKRNEAFDMAIKALEAMDNTENTLQHVGSVERLKGHWIKRFGSINCSVCKHSNWSDSFEDLVRSFNFCPNCGADMRGENE